MPASLHTKWRPKQFQDVIGQEAVVRSLRKVIKKREAHTFLFSGPSGTGKTTLARICARRLGCDSANLVEVDAASHTGVDDMRAVMEAARYTAIGGAGVRCFILDEVHRLSSPAWESLLKSLEEPPEHVFWFLCTTLPDKVPTTIKTRCVRYNLTTVDEGQIHQWLSMICKADGIQQTAEILELIADKANGSPRQALTYLAAIGEETRRKRALRLMEGATEGKEVIDLCRYLIGNEPKNWERLVKYLKPLEAQSGEGIRQVILAYMGKVVMGSKSNKSVLRPLLVIDALDKPCEGSAKIHPIATALAGLILLRNYK